MEKNYGGIKSAFQQLQNEKLPPPSASTQHPPPSLQLLSSSYQTKREHRKSLPILPANKASISSIIGGTYVCSYFILFGILYYIASYRDMPTMVSANNQLTSSSYNITEQHYNIRISAWLVLLTNLNHSKHQTIIDVFLCTWIWNHIILTLFIRYPLNPCYRDLKLPHVTTIPSLCTRWSLKLLI